MPIILLVLVIFLVFAVVGWLNANKKLAELSQAPAPKPVLVDTEADSLRAQLSTVRADSQKARAEAETKEKELAKLRAELKDQKQKSHAQAKESERLAQRVGELHTRQKSQSSVEDARDQMLAAVNEAASLRAEIDRLKGELKDRRPARVEVAAQPETVQVSESQPRPSDDEVIRTQVARVKNQLKDQSRDQRNQMLAELKADREKFLDEIKSLRKRLSKALADFDRERRRAENTDKAYLILKSQLDAALDRIASVDWTMRRPGGSAYPDQRAKRVVEPATDLIVDPTPAAVEPAPTVETVAAEPAVVAPAAVEPVAVEPEPVEPAPAEAEPKAAPAAPSVPEAPAAPEAAAPEAAPAPAAPAEPAPEPPVVEEAPVMPRTPTGPVPEIDEAIDALAGGDWDLDDDHKV